MKHTYKITGMTCENCEAKVKGSLLTVPHITSADVSREKETVTIEMEQHVPLSTLQSALDKKYTISAISHHENAEQLKSWFSTYKPILLIFMYVTTLSLLGGIRGNTLELKEVMRYFMAGFFIAFSFFKMLDLKGFAESYATYDIVARKLPAWGYVYAWIELGLGIAFLTAFHPLLTNLITFIVMSVSIIGVLQSVLNKRKIQCACLGVVFNLPMSTVTIIEDALMIVMSLAMMYMML